jgi:RNA polymerase sigma factor (sigma-70 family)
MVQSLSSRFIDRLKARDPEAWFELWQIFGPVLQGTIRRWGRGIIGAETVRDVSQETLAALSDAIDRHDPSKGARFSTWLLAIARHTLGDELDRRNALKRGSGKKPSSLDETWTSGNSPSPDSNYEAAVFRAKVHAAIRSAEMDCDFMAFSIYRMRVFDGLSGKEVAASVGISEPTVSRRLAKVREVLRRHLEEIIGTYSFTEEELQEAARNGLELNPKKVSDTLFDEALAEVFHTQVNSPPGSSPLERQ